MNILILSGGTGSIALQQGIYDNFERSPESGIRVNVLTNCYDNGLSTGAVRQVMDGAILGPSDLRKNQTTRLSLEKPKHWEALRDFLNIRFSVPTNEARDYCHESVERLELKTNKHWTPFKEAIDEYFSYPDASLIRYDDFSLANIIYAGMASLNGNDLEQAGIDMATWIGLSRSHVILNDNESLFLKARTTSGKIIEDEGDIVSWNNPDDPIVDVLFEDRDGAPAHPVLSKRAKYAIEHADVIILSAGTQWSSLIPTYKSEGFKEAITKAHSRGVHIIMIANKVPDKDAPEKTGMEWLEIINQYFPPQSVEVLVSTYTNKVISESLQTSETLPSAFIDTNFFIESGFDSVHSSTHDSNSLARIIGYTLFKPYFETDFKLSVFDYDGTLVGKDRYQAEESDYNCRSLSNVGRFAICTANSKKALTKLPSLKERYEVYADQGMNIYEAYRGDLTLKSSMVNASFDAQGVMNDVLDLGISKFIIENRGDASIAIKPIPERWMEFTHNVLSNHFENDPTLKVEITGSTTIEIFDSHTGKKAALENLLSKLKPEQKIIYFGDEPHGLDFPFFEASIYNPDKVAFIQIVDPADLSILFRTIRLIQNFN